MYQFEGPLYLFGLPNQFEHQSLGIVVVASFFDYEGKIGLHLLFLRRVELLADLDELLY